MSEHQELYVHLPEHLEADVLYVRFHKVIDEPDAFSINTGLALRMFAGAVQREHGLRRGWFRLFLAGRRAKHLFERVEYHQQLEQELRRRASAI